MKNKTRFQKLSRVLSLSLLTLLSSALILFAFFTWSITHGWGWTYYWQRTYQTSQGIEDLQEEYFQLQPATLLSSYIGTSSAHRYIPSTYQWGRDDTPCFYGQGEYLYGTDMTLSAFKEYLLSELEPLGWEQKSDLFVRGEHEMIEVTNALPSGYLWLNAELDSNQARRQYKTVIQVTLSYEWPSWQLCP